MSKNEYRDLHDGIENLINTFDGSNDENENNVEAPEVNVDELLSADDTGSEEDLTVSVDELEASVDGEKKNSDGEKSTSVSKGKNNKKDGKKSKKSSGKSSSKNSNRDKETSKKTEKSNDGPSSKAEEEKTSSPAKLIITLVAICAAVALLLGAVNLLTSPQIEENNRKATLESIRNIFDYTVEVRDIEVPEGSGIGSAYLVIKNGCICGYSVTVAPNGFGGPIDLMVGMGSDGKVVGVDVVSMSETPGLGSRVSGRDFLDQFKNTSGEVSVDVISGASISSRAVIAGVNTVTANLIDLQSLAREYGMSIIPFKAETVPVTEENAATDDKAVVPTPPETAPPADTNKGQAAPDVSKNDSPPDVIVPNPGDGNGGINAEYASDTTEYETLTTEPDSTEPETSVSGESETETKTKTETE